MHLHFEKMNSRDIALSRQGPDFRPHLREVAVAEIERLALPRDALDHALELIVPGGRETIRGIRARGLSTNFCI